MSAAELRAWGSKVDRAGMSQAVIDAVDAFDGSYKEAMRLAGTLSQIAIAARCDSYWNEQVEHGKLNFLRKTRAAASRNASRIASRAFDAVQS